MQPFVMEVNLFIEPEHAEDYRAALKEVIDQARAEPTCRYLYVYESTEDPNTIVVVESWADLPTYREEVLNREYFREFLAATEAMYAAPRRVLQLLPLHGIDGRA
jgi:quinol monooxygenase YgiN